MGIPVMAPRSLAERKPPHGSPCTRCGLCCYATLCELAERVFGAGPGPCPALSFDKAGSRCGLVDHSMKQHKEAALLLIGSGTGCDARINGEPVNDAFNKRLDKWDADHASEISAARKVWGL